MRVRAFQFYGDPLYVLVDPPNNIDGLVAEWRAACKAAPDDGPLFGDFLRARGVEYERPDVTGLEGEDD